jgi:hypothetical protein
VHFNKAAVENNRVLVHFDGWSSAYGKYKQQLEID